MRELNTIISDVDHYLIERSEDKDSDYEKRAEHYEKVKQLFQNNAYVDLVDHINSGITQFEKISLRKQKYRNFLLELKKIFEALNEKEKITRQTQLISAILSDDAQKIHQVLQAGGYAVLTKTYFDYDKSYVQFDKLAPLAIAIITENQKAIEKLLSEISEEHLNNVLLEEPVQKYFMQAKNPNVILDSKKGFTLLHYFVERGLNDYLEEFLNLKNLNINARRNDGSTALLYACRLNSTEAAIMFLKKNANANLCMNINNKDYSPIYFAIANNNVKLVELLLENGALLDYNAIKLLQRQYSSNPLKYKEIHRLCKTKLRENKDLYVLMGPINTVLFQPSNNILDELQHDSKLLSNILMTKIHTQDNPILSNVLRENLERFCIENSQTKNILKPMFIIVAMGCLGLRRDLNSQKPFKSFINNQTNVADFSIGAGKLTTGRYTLKNSVFIAGNTNHMLGTLFHEWKHYVGDEVYKLSFSDEMKKKFEEVKAELYQNYSNFPEDDQKNSQLNLIKDSFHCILYSNNKRYNIHTRMEELLARVPETIGVLGPEDGENWLKTNTPKLYEFYTKVYNPMLLVYIKYRIAYAKLENAEKLLQQNFCI